MDMKINSSVDLGLLDFPEVRMSLPNVAIPPRSCFCVQIAYGKLSRDNVGGLAIKIVSLVSCEV